MAKKKKKRPRTARRARERRLTKLASDREKLAAYEPGGSPGRPLDVPSASVIELRAAEFSCLRCDGQVRVEAHEAQTVEGQALRRLQLGCAQCGAKRELWVRIVPSTLN